MNTFGIVWIHWVLGKISTILLSRSTFIQNVPKMIQISLNVFLGSNWRSVNIGRGSGLVLPGNDPLPRPMFGKICDAIWHNYAKMINMTCLVWKRYCFRKVLERPWLQANFVVLPVKHLSHYSDVIMGVIVSQSTSLTIVYSTVYSGADQRNH